MPKVTEGLQPVNQSATVKLVANPLFHNLWAGTLWFFVMTFLIPLCRFFSLTKWIQMKFEVITCVRRREEVGLQKHENLHLEGPWKTVQTGSY